MTADVKRVYAFGKDAEGNNVTEGNKDMKNILGGKGANLAEMALIGLPVPPGFTMQTRITRGLKARSTPFRSTASTSRSASASALATPKIHCSFPFVPALPCRCPA